MIPWRSNFFFLGHQSLRKSSSHDEKRKNFDRELVDGVLIAVLISSGVAYELLSCGVNVRGFDARPGAYYFGSVSKYICICLSLQCLIVLGGFDRLDACLHSCHKKKLTFFVGICLSVCSPVCASLRLWVHTVEGIFLPIVKWLSLALSI